MNSWQLIHRRPNLNKNIVSIFIVNKDVDPIVFYDKDKSDKMYHTEKDLFKHEIGRIVRYHNKGMLSHAYDDVLGSVEYLKVLTHEKYPEYLI